VLLAFWFCFCFLPSHYRRLFIALHHIASHRIASHRIVLWERTKTWKKKNINILRRMASIGVSFTLLRWGHRWCWNSHILYNSVTACNIVVGTYHGVRKALPNGRVVGEVQCTSNELETVPSNKENWLKSSVLPSPMCIVVNPTGVLTLRYTQRGKKNIVSTDDGANSFSYLYRCQLCVAVMIVASTIIT